MTLHRCVDQIEFRFINSFHSIPISKLQTLIIPTTPPHFLLPPIPSLPLLPPYYPSFPPPLCITPPTTSTNPPPSPSSHHSTYYFYHPFSLFPLCRFLADELPRRLASRPPSDHSTTTTPSPVTTLQTSALEI